MGDQWTMLCVCVWTKKVKRHLYVHGKFKFMRNRQSRPLDQFMSIYLSVVALYSLYRMVRENLCDRCLINLTHKFVVLWYSNYFCYLSTDANVVEKNCTLTYYYYIYHLVVSWGNASSFYQPPSWALQHPEELI